MKRRRNNKRAAFTLMEILLVAAILVILASMATIAFSGIGADTTKSLARTEIETYEQASKMFQIQNMRLPNSLDELVNTVNGRKPYIEDGDKVDPWGREYKYSVNTDLGKAIITSAGPDGDFNTAADNVTNDPRANQQQGG